MIMMMRIEGVLDGHSMVGIKVMVLVRYKTILLPSETLKTLNTVNFMNCPIRKINE
jgi:hypothetical protein